jgi:hypothetical protein
MTNDQVQALAKAWAAAQAIAQAHRSESEWQAIYDVQNLADGEPDTLWEVVLNVLKLRPSEEVLGMLAASPLEDLIQDHGVRFVDRVADEAGRNPAFAALLPKVWIPLGNDPTTLRFVTLGCDVVKPFNRPLHPSAFGAG